MMFGKVLNFDVAGMRNFLEMQCGWKCFKVD
jgi:hypothetical protein